MLVLTCRSFEGGLARWSMSKWRRGLADGSKIELGGFTTLQVIKCKWAKMESTDISFGYIINT